MSRALLLIAVLTFTSVSPAAAAPVPNPSFVFPSVPYSFSTTTNTFEGNASNGLLTSASGEANLSATLSVTFTDLGELVGGTFQITGGIASLGIPAGSLLMQGQVTGILTIFDTNDLLSPVFDLVVDSVNPLLGFPADIGEWQASVCKFNPQNLPDSANCPASVGDLFTTDYTDVTFPTSSIVRSSHEVPYPAAGLLLGLGLALLAARQRLRRS
jgi:hypothetical protein